MGTIELKANLHELIDSINDKNILSAIYILLTKKNKTEIDFWNDLPEVVQNDIKEAIKEADRGDIFTHDQVLNEIMEKYNISL